MVIGYEVVAAAVRRPAEVIGDGRTRIGALIEKQSRRRQAATGGESQIPLDEETQRCLRDAGFDFDSVLPEGKRLSVRRTANLHTGGTLEDVTAQLHPVLIDAAVRAARALDIPVVGLDLLVPAPDQPEYVFIEANERVGSPITSRSRPPSASSTCSFRSASLADRHPPGLGRAQAIHRRAAHGRPSRCLHPFHRVAARPPSTEVSMTAQLPEPDLNYMQRVLLEMLAIPSPTGFTDTIVRYVAERLTELGIPFELTRRGTIRATLKGRRYSRTARSPRT